MGNISTSFFLINLTYKIQSTQNFNYYQTLFLIKH
nr:MAG TPA: hypothetical protein [Caudoviricetes sp.]